MMSRSWLLAVLAAAACGGAAARENTPGAARPGSADRSAAAAGRAAAAVIDPRVEAADRARIRGDSSAKVWLVVVSDFQCPYCKLWFDSTAPALEREYVATGKVRVAYVNFPLSMHPHAEQAAEAAMCAGAQDRFWAYHDRLFQTQGDWAPRPDVTAYFASLAADLGLDTAAFAACTRDRVMRDMVLADQQRGRAAGVASTPTLLVGTERREGAWPIDSLRPLLDRALAAAGGGNGGEGGGGSR